MSFSDRLAGWRQNLSLMTTRPATAEHSPWRRVALGVIIVFLVLLLVLAWYWSREPDAFWVSWETEGRQAATGPKVEQLIACVI